MAAMVPEDARIEGDEAGLKLDSTRIHIYADGHLVAAQRAGA